MKDLKRKLIAALGAVTMAVTSALPASAVYDMSTDITGMSDGYDILF